MAGKTTVNGTSYDIKSGKTTVNGTTYDIKSGKTTVNGTTYDIKFEIESAIVGLIEGGTSFQPEVRCITYANGYYVVGGKTNNYPFIAYATELDGNWTVKDEEIFTNGPYAYESAVNKIIYEPTSQNWILVGIVGSSSQGVGFLYYSQNLTSENWGSVSLSGCLSNEVNDIIIAEDNLVACGRHSNNSAYCGYASITNEKWKTSNNWSSKLLWTRTSGASWTATSIAYKDGLFIAGGGFKSKPSSSRSAYFVYSKGTDPSGTWTSITNFWTNSTSAAQYLNRVVITNGLSGTEAGFIYGNNRGTPQVHKITNSNGTLSIATSTNPSVATTDGYSAHLNTAEGNILYFGSQNNTIFATQGDATVISGVKGNSIERPLDTIYINDCYILVGQHQTFDTSGNITGYTAAVYYSPDYQKFFE